MSEQILLSSEDLLQFFIHHLNRVYAAKVHLLNRLPEILYQVHFTDLEEAINETIELVQMQRQRMKYIFQLLNADIEEGSVSGLKGLIDDSFEDVKAHKDNSELRDMSIMFYMANVEAMEMASFQILLLLSVKIGNPEVKALIRENFNEAQADKALMLLIATKYLTTVKS